MTRTEMLAMVRTDLMETAADFWLDADIYKWLSNAQYAVIDGLMDEALSEYYETEQDTGSSGIVVLPVTATMYRFVTVVIGTSAADAEPAVMIPADEQKRLLDDPYLPGTTTYPIAWFKDGSLYYRPTASTWVNFEYIPVPADIDASNDSTLPDFTHISITNYATARAWEFQNERLDLAQKSDLLFQQFIEKTNKQYLGRTNTRQSLQINPNS